MGARDTLRIGGAARIVLHVPATGEVLDAGDVFTYLPLEDSPEYFQGDDGGRTVYRRTRSLGIGIIRESDLRQIEAWQRAGKEIALFIEGHLGAVHTIWDEPVEIHLRETGSRYSRLAPKELNLLTRNLQARVFEDADLLAGFAWDDENGDSLRIALPLRGSAIRVQSEEGHVTTVDVLGHDDEVLVTDTSTEGGAAVAVVPSTGYWLRVTSTGPRPRVEIDPDGWIFEYVSSEDDVVSYRSAGRYQLIESVEVIDVFGEQVEVPVYIVPEEIRARHFISPSKKADGLDLFTVLAPVADDAT